jgi:hypothetical protein
MTAEDMGTGFKYLDMTNSRMLWSVVARERNPSIFEKNRRKNIRTIYFIVKKIRKPTFNSLDFGFTKWNYEEFYLLGFKAMQSDKTSRTFRRNILPKSSVCFLLATYLA